MQTKSKDYAPVRLERAAKQKLLGFKIKAQAMLGREITYSEAVEMLVELEEERSMPREVLAKS